MDLKFIKNLTKGGNLQFFVIKNNLSSSLDFKQLHLFGLLVLNQEYQKLFYSFIREHSTFNRLLISNVNIIVFITIFDLIRIAIARPASCFALAAASEYIH